MNHYTQLTLKERCQLHAYLDMNWPLTAIAKQLGRHRSTLYRELERNSYHRGYSPWPAQHAAQARQLRSPYKFRVNTTVYKYVLGKLKQGWSPEQIAGRLKRTVHKIRICHETIYQYIYKHAREMLYRYLPTQRQHRLRRKAQHVRQPFCGVRAIKNRPKQAEARTHVGHWEGDTMRFSNKRKPSITTLVDRKTRLLILCKNIYSTSSLVMNNIREAIQQLPKKYCRTITFDQGTEFADFAHIERYTPCKVFYAQAGSPWQRGTNENTNGRLRRYLPRQADPDTIHQDGLDIIADRLNNTPRKCLGYLTPKEVFLQHLRQPCRTSL